MPDYYNVLRVGHNASQKEIKKAYERLLKEANYDTTIDRVGIETAYRILTDIASKARYDARHTLKTKKLGNDKKSRLNVREFLEWFTRPRLVMICIALLLITAGFYWLRFGYMLQTFQAGDVLWDKGTHKRYGKIVRVESNHQFEDAVSDAYQLQLDRSNLVIGNPGQTLIWLPQDTIKKRCYKP